jgi:YbbR domain-containing protein
MNWIKKHKFLTIAILLALFLIITTAGKSDKTTTGTSQTSTTTTTAQTTPAPAKVSLDEFYGQVSNGMTKAQVNALAGGREPSTCSEMQTEYTGKIETCNYGGFTDSGIVMIQYTGDKVTSKSNTKF